MKPVFESRHERVLPPHSRCVCYREHQCHLAQQKETYTAYVGTIRRSLDGGNTWNTLDSWVPSKRLTPFALGVTCDPAGNVFVVGDGGDRWCVRMRAAGSTTWTTIDSFQLATGRRASAHAAATDAEGNVYVVGGAYDASNEFWVVRKLAR